MMALMVRLTDVMYGNIIMSRSLVAFTGDYNHDADGEGNKATL